jgi:hypothetical protein
VTLPLGQLRDIGAIGDYDRPAIGLRTIAARLGLAGFPKRPLGNALAILLRALAELGEIGRGLTLDMPVIAAIIVRR